MSWKNTATLLPAAILLSALGACDLLGLGEEAADGGIPADCGSAECQHELTVEVIRPDADAFLPGSYTFSLVAPDGSEYSIDCYYSDPDFGMDCEYGDVDVILADTDADAMTIFLDIVGAPEYVLVVVEQDGWVIGERTLYPEYEIVTPNGEECPPACYVGEETMAVNPW